MKRIKTVIVLALILVGFTTALIWLWNKNQENPVKFSTESPKIETVVLKTVATGSIVPEEEILIKPNISGVVEQVFKEAGDYVKSGDLIAKIRVIPSLSALASAKNAIASSETALQTAKINLETQSKNYNRQKALFDKGVISSNDFEGINNAYLTAKQGYEQAKINLNSSRQNYDIIKTGSTSGLGNVAQTQVRATVSGMILDVPVKTGNQVIESNNFNEGTTIASIADINKMIFEGKVDESEVGKIKEGLPLEITIGAIENQTFEAVLDYIAPKGVAENGAIQFEIKGTLTNAKDTFIRAGLSANASIILDKVENVLTIKEALVQYDPKTKLPFVEIEESEQQFAKRDLKLGLSDGINVQVIEGVKEGEQIKVWNRVKGFKGYGN